MSTLDHAIESLKQLVSFPSVSATSNGEVSTDVAARLRELGFSVEQTEYDDPRGVRKVNLVARRDPTSSNSGKGGLAYFCHTDVVPAEGWTGPGGDPFRGVIEGERIFARGSCDMKGSLVAMMSAASLVPQEQQTRPIWIVCTADEEVGFAGAKELVAASTQYKRIVEAQPLALIGEPTRLSVVHAHKGITGGKIISRGRAAHSSTTDGVNANEAMVPMLQKLLEIAERTRSEKNLQDDRFDPPVLSWNFGVSDHCTAVNITPDRSVAWFSLRPMPNIDGSGLIDEVKATAESLGLEFELFEGGETFWQEADADSIQALCELAGGDPHTVCYGTDGGEFAELKHRVVCGPGDIAQAHTTDEFLEIDQLNKGIELYRRTIEKWCTGS